MAPATLFDRLDTLGDIQALIDAPIQESETVEYKTATGRILPGEHKEVARDVSAFANSLGGTIIYGISADPNDKTRPRAIEPIDPANVAIILQVVATHIAHPVRGIRNKVIGLGDGRTACLVVDIPASAIAPHQVITDHRYYHRTGPHTVPMPHNLVELQFGRRLSPILQPIHLLTRTQAHAEKPPFYMFRFTFCAENVGPRPARDVSLVVTAPRKGTFKISGQPTGPEYKSVTRDRTFVFTLNEQNVLHPGLLSSELWIELAIHVDEIKGELPVMTASIYADEMLPIRQNLAIVFDSWDDAYKVKPTDLPDSVQSRTLG